MTAALQRFAMVFGVSVAIAAVIAVVGYLEFLILDFMNEMFGMGWAMVAFSLSVSFLIGCCAAVFGADTDE